MCYLAQEEINDMAKQMVREIKTNMGAELGILFQLPCAQGVCPMPVVCNKLKGRIPQDTRYEGINIKEWFDI